MPLCEGGGDDTNARVFAVIRHYRQIVLETLKLVSPWAKTTVPLTNEEFVSGTVVL